MSERMLRPDPEQEQEWRRQNGLIYGGLIAIGTVLVQPFLTVESLDPPVVVCVVSFAVAIPLLAALILVNRLEVFRRRRARSGLVIVDQVVGQAGAFAGIVAGFWHIRWYAGVTVLASAAVGVAIHRAGYVRIECERAQASNDTPPR